MTNPRKQYSTGNDEIEDLDHVNRYDGEDLDESS